MQRALHHNASWPPRHRRGCIAAQRTSERGSGHRSCSTCISCLRGTIVHNEARRRRGAGWPERPTRGSGRLPGRWRRAALWHVILQAFADAVAAIASPGFLHLPSLSFGGRGRLLLHLVLLFTQLWSGACARDCSLGFSNWPCGRSRNCCFALRTSLCSLGQATPCTSQCLRVRHTGAVLGTMQRHRLEERMTTLTETQRIGRCCREGHRCVRCRRRRLTRFAIVRQRGALFRGDVTCHFKGTFTERQSRGRHAGHRGLCLRLLAGHHP